MNKAKLIATVGPTCSDVESLEKLINEGVSIFRLNFSFGDYDQHAEHIKNIRNVSKKCNKAVAILQDLQGPKIRIGQLKNDVVVKENDEIVLTGQDEHKDEFYLPTTYSSIADDAQAGETILLADGKIGVIVTETIPEKAEVHCKVVHGGTILTGKGINLPNTNISMPALTDKDVEDAKFGAKIGVDYIALSFVRAAKDVVKLKDLLKTQNVEIPIIAKIEKPEALTNLDEILNEVDGVMVARGDLAVEISFAAVPAVQKEIIKKANCKGKLTIVATEMLSSMIDNPRPTRAEASDVANALLDGTDVVMLSNETAMGNYPIAAVKAMSLIIEETEKTFKYENVMPPLHLPEELEQTRAICAAATYLSYACDEKAFLTLSTAGRSARLLSKHRTQSYIYAFTFDEDAYNRMAFYHNVCPVLLTEKSFDKNGYLYYSSAKMKDDAKKFGFVEDGDLVIMLRGTSDKGNWTLAHIKMEHI